MYGLEAGPATLLRSPPRRASTLLPGFRMFKPVLGLAAVGVLGFLLLPLIGTLLGVVFFFVKIALVVFAIWLLFRLFRKRPNDEAKAE
jgi:membrane protein implicated in regulation of membrane protease activity